MPLEKYEGIQIHARGALLVEIGQLGKTEKSVESEGWHRHDVVA